MHGPADTFMSMSYSAAADLPKNGPDGAPSPPSAGRSRNMRAIRRSGTKPEVELRSALHALGLRFRKDLRLDLGEVKPRPDIVFTRARLAVFVDGCFWHCCPQHSKPPSVNTGYWGPKLARNVERDRADDAALRSSGWMVLRVWEHESVEAAALRITQLLSRSADRKVR